MTTTMRAVRTAALLALAALALGGCRPEPPASPPSPTVMSTPTPTASPSPPDPIAGMSLDERVGQLFMVGTSVGGPDPITLAAVSQQHIGGVFLHGRSGAGVEAGAAFSQQFQAAHDPAAPSLWIATDQEGGDVQVLSGAGFDTMPTAFTQARTLDDAGLRAAAARWGSQLHAAGVNMNLAPVADIVTGPDAVNPPIGALNRHYGFDAAVVAGKAGAFAAGMREADVLPTLKHFPGLGRVTQNTDYGTGVTDDQVAADSPDVTVYRTLLAEGPAVVMMSSAIYTRLDPAGPAVFSQPVVTDLLRERLDFDGVVMTDDVSAADQLSAWSPADRALLSIAAGVDVVLVSADPRVFPQMYDAVLARAQADPAFAAQVDDAARRIVTLKQSFDGG